MSDLPKFLTIRETAKLGFLSEHNLRMRLAQGLLPHIKAGTKCLVNVNQLIENLEAESKAALCGGVQHEKY